MDELDASLVASGFLVVRLLIWISGKAVRRCKDKWNAPTDHPGATSDVEEGGRVGACRQGSPLSMLAGGDRV